MHLGDVEERFEIAWRDTFPGLWRVSVGEWSFLCGLPKGPGDLAGWRKDVRGSHVAIEENEPDDTRVGSVSRGEEDMLS